MCIRDRYSGKYGIHKPTKMIFYSPSNPVPFIMLYFLATLTLVHGEDQPAYPLWPLTFTQQFNETTKVLFRKGTLGTMYYDFGNLRSRVDRDDGSIDRYCGINGLWGFYNTPCSHIVVEGERYLYYPEYDHCCYCCSAADGCGVVKPDWLNGAEFEGVVDHFGQTVYKWNQKGLQDNLYYETIENNPLKREMVGLYQMPNALQDFRERKDSVPDNIFDLPSSCSKRKKCNFFSTCTIVRS